MGRLRRPFITRLFKIVRYQRCRFASCADCFKLSSSFFLNGRRFKVEDHLPSIVPLPCFPYPPDRAIFQPSRFSLYVPEFTIGWDLSVYYLAFQAFNNVWTWDPMKESYSLVRCKERVSFSDLPFFFERSCFNMIEQFLVTGFLTHMGWGLSIISCSPGKRSINKSIEFSNFQPNKSPNCSNRRGTWPLAASYTNE